jgi:hypothetical protein
MSLRKESKQRVDRIRVDYSDLSDGVTINYEPTIKAGGIVTSVFYDVLEEFWEEADLTGGELVLNGGFSSTSDWTFGGNWSYNNLENNARLQTGAASNLDQTLFVTAGATYQVSFNVPFTALNGTATIVFNLAGGSVSFTASTQGVTHTGYITTTNTGGLSFTGNGIRITGTLTGGNGVEIQDVSVQLVNDFIGSGTISIGLEDQDDDIFSDDMNGVSFEVGIRQGSGTGMVGSGALLPFSIKTTVDRQLAVRWDLGAGDLQAGKMDVYIVWNEGKTT